MRRLRGLGGILAALRAALGVHWVETHWQAEGMTPAPLPCCYHWEWGWRWRVSKTRPLPCFGQAHFSPDDQPFRMRPRGVFARRRGGRVVSLTPEGVHALRRAFGAPDDDGGAHK